MQIEYSKQAAKAISKINNPFKRNIKEAIEKLPDGDVKSLKAIQMRIGCVLVITAYCLT